MGYARNARLRMVPLDGAEATVDMMTAFADAGGPVSMRESFTLDAERRADVNRRMSSRVFGYRWAVDMRFVIANADNTYYIGQFAERAANRDWTLYLTVDAGATEHEVILRSFKGPLALGRKTFIGAEYDMRWESVGLLAAPPALSSATPAQAATPLYAVPVTACAAAGLPAASEAFRGCIRYAQGSPDIAYICMQQAGGSYEWIEIGSGYQFPQYTTATRPVASLTWKNRVIAVRDAAGATKLQACVENSTPGSYDWKDFAEGWPW